MRAIVIDEQRSYRECLEIALWQMASVSVVAHAGSARQMYALIETHNPDLVILDLMLNDTDGISAVRELHRRGCSPRTLILSSQFNPHFVRDAFRAGADGYCLKSQPLSELIAAVQAAGAGQRYLSPQLQTLPEELPGADLDPQATALGYEKLSPREREVFCRILQGDSTRDIAHGLCISLKTVETHRLHINRKLGVHSPGELFRFAAASGMMLV